MENCKAHIFPQGGSNCQSLLIASRWLETKVARSPRLNNKSEIKFSRGIVILFENVTRGTTEDSMLVNKLGLPSDLATPLKPE